jgi:DegV family protein with EDD domain
MMAFFCREARILERSGCSVEEIMRRLESIRSRINIVFTIDNLEFARLSGRISSLQSILASLLKIKPIIILRDGMLDIGERVRSRHHSFERILNLVKTKVGEKPVNLAVVHANDADAGKDLLDRARKMFTCRETFLADLSISVAAHLGPGAVGIVAYTIED